MDSSSTRAYQGSAPSDDNQNGPVDNQNNFSSYGFSEVFRWVHSPDRPIAFATAQHGAATQDPATQTSLQSVFSQLPSNYFNRPTSASVQDSASNNSTHDINYASMGGAFLGSVPNQST